MTSLFVAQRALLAEVEARILALAPEYEETTRFSCRGELDRSLSDLGDNTGRPRLFEITQGQLDAPFMLGVATGFKFRHQIEIMYPNNLLWGVGLCSDYDLIRHDLITNPTTLSGVQQRHVDPFAQLGIERNPGDPWQKLVIELIVYYEVS